MIRRSAITALAGVVVLLVGIFAAAVYFEESQGGGYSPLNHFISELGWGRDSPKAWVFNTCICVGGLLLMPIMLMMGERLCTPLGRAGMSVGVFAALCGGAVGLLPLEFLVPHLCVALLFFLGLFLSISLFTIALCREGHADWTSRAVIAAGCVAAAACAALIALPKGEMLRFLTAPDSFLRPDFWWLPFAEWSAFASMCIWVGTVAALLWRRRVS
jgi:hypothetical membrane protein